MLVFVYQQIKPQRDIQTQNENTIDSINWANS